LQGVNRLRPMPGVGEVLNLARASGARRTAARSYRFPILVNSDVFSLRRSGWCDLNRGLGSNRESALRSAPSRLLRPSCQRGCKPRLLCGLAEAFERKWRCFAAEFALPPGGGM